MFHGRKLGLLVAVIFAAQNVFAEQNIEAVPGEYIVQLNNNQNAQVASLRSLFNAEEVRVVSKSENIFAIKRNILERKEMVLAEIASNSAVAIVEPNYIYRTNDLPNDPQLGDLWGMINTGQKDGVEGVDIGADKAWELTTGSHDVIVAVIDTGVDYTHPDIKDNMWTNTAELNGVAGKDDDGNGFVDDIYGYDFANKDGNPMDDHNHGTHVAGTIGASGNNSEGVVGVNWKVRIMALKFLTGSGGGTLEGAVQAIDYAILMKAHLSNNSWGGGGKSQILQQAVQRAQAAGQLFVAAAGNDSMNTDVRPMYPASFDEDIVLSVAAINRMGALASFSNYGRVSVDVAAPGRDILSTIVNDKYKVYSGTSMASPHVAGIAALLLSQEPDLTWSQVKERIMTTARPLGPVKAKTVSGGVANAYYALVNEMPPPDPNDPSNWKNKPITISTAHPYAKSTNQEWVVEAPGAARMAVYFDRFETERGYDTVTLLDANGVEFAKLSGNLDGTYSPFTQGDKITIRFKSDGSVNKYGFDITAIAFENEKVLAAE